MDMVWCAGEEGSAVHQRGVRETDSCYTAIERSLAVPPVPDWPRRNEVALFYSNPPSSGPIERVQSLDRVRRYLLDSRCYRQTEEQMPKLSKARSGRPHHESMSHVP
jgi:hypothetical protein